MGEGEGGSVEGWRASDGLGGGGAGRGLGGDRLRGMWYGVRMGKPKSRTDLDIERLMDTDLSDSRRDQLVPSSLEADYLRLAMAQRGLDEDEVRETIKRHLVVMLGQVNSVKEFLDVVSRLSDLCAWKKSAELKAATATTKDEDKETEEIAQLRRMLEK